MNRPVMFESKTSELRPVGRMKALIKTSNLQQQFANFKILLKSSTTPVCILLTKLRALWVMAGKMPIVCVVLPQVLQFCLVLNHQDYDDRSPGTLLRPIFRRMFLGIAGGTERPMLWLNSSAR